MYVVYESVGAGGAKVITRHETCADALAELSRLTDGNYELDADHEGCADGLAKDGRVLCVEPASRRAL